MRAVLLLVPLLTTLAPGHVAFGQVRDPTYAEVQRSTVDAGSAIGVSGGGWRPGTRVEFEMAGRDVGDAGVGERGFFDTEIRIPDVSEGEYVLSVRGTSDKGEPFTVRLDIDVTRGTTRMGWVAIIVGAVVVVGVLVVVGMMLLRRRAYRAG